jgi:hypothetical protein
MNENLREFFEKSATHVFFCDKKTKAIVWSNNENIHKTIKKSACELFEGRIFPEETGIVCGILHGEPYRYNITETDDCFVIEVLNKNLVSEGMKIDSLRKKFHYEAVNIKEYIYEMYRGFPEGVTETYIHPAYETDELKGTTGCWERRVWEYKLFSDPQTKQHIDSLGIKLINYRDLAKMRAAE